MIESVEATRPETARRPSLAVHYHRKGQTLSIRQSLPYPSREGRGRDWKRRPGHPDGPGGVSLGSVRCLAGAGGGGPCRGSVLGALGSPWGRLRPRPVGRREREKTPPTASPRLPGRRHPQEAIRHCRVPSGVAVSVDGPFLGGEGCQPVKVIAIDLAGCFRDRVFCQIMENLGHGFLLLWLLGPYQEVKAEPAKNPISP